MTVSKINVAIARSVRLFSKLSDAHLTTLLASASLRRVPARTVLFAEGQRLDNLCTVVQGMVELYSERDDRRSTIAVIRAVRPFVLPSILADRNPLSARTLESSELIVVPTPLVVELFGQDPGFACALAHELAGECHGIIEDFKCQRMRTTIERVARWMLRSDEEGGGTGRIVIPYDKRILASYLGMAPEHLSRSFSALASAGVVVHGRHVTLKDRAALSAAAGANWTRPIRPNPHAGSWTTRSKGSSSSKR
jgi:CRP/FNR family transcriptional regulator, transcriptional activator FtrB